MTAAHRLRLGCALCPAGEARTPPPPSKGNLPRRNEDLIKKKGYQGSLVEGDDIRGERNGVYVLRRNLYLEESRHGSKTKRSLGGLARGIVLWDVRRAKGEERSTIQESS